MKKLLPVILLFCSAMAYSKEPSRYPLSAGSLSKPVEPSVESDPRDVELDNGPLARPCAGVDAPYPLLYVIRLVVGGARVVEFAQDDLGALAKRHARLGQEHALADAAEERGTKRLLELGDLLRDARL